MTAFEHATQLLPSVIAHSTMHKYGHKFIGTPLSFWFCEHCELRANFYWQHADPQWRRWMTGQKAREQLYRFIALWCKDFIRNPIRYRLDHPHAQFK
jgi:hypothetical protein